MMLVVLRTSIHDGAILVTGGTRRLNSMQMGTDTLQNLSDIIRLVNLLALTAAVNTQKS